MFTSPFKNFTIPESAKFVFVADMFAEDYVGGAELTSQALIDSCPEEICLIRAKDVNIETLRSGFDKFWIFGNCSTMNMELIPSIVANMDYCVLEYDYKFCKYRSVEKHLLAEGKECDCDQNMHGKMISAFYYGAKNIWWMSEAQQNLYFEKFPFLKEKQNTVLSSVFDEKFFQKVAILREESKNIERKGWIVLGSTSWIKGASDAEEWCKENNKEYEVIWGIPYDQVLEKLSKAEGFVYLPTGGDTCPRMVIEAKLLGCELHLNNNVQHKNEIWFDTEDRLDTESYLYAARNRFWSAVRSTRDYVPSVSSYTTTRNCISQKYPWKECINSVLEFSEEVVVVDGGSTDGTWEALQKWSETEEKLKIYQISRDWSSERHAVYDGLQKAEARKRCTSEFLWQIDSDEIVHQDDAEKIKGICKNFPTEVDLICLPVIEYWGGPEKVRMDINPWKWRLSRNLSHITHGIPKQLRQYDSKGNLYASPGTDGCDYIHSETYELIPFGNFMTSEVELTRRQAMSGDQKAFEAYEQWFNVVIDQIPGVHHYSWFDLPRKIKTYKNYWSKHWQSLYDIQQEDTPENNMFFNKSWSEVSDEDIDDLSFKLKEYMGGWVFHSRVDFNSPTPHLTVKRDQPSVMLENE